jgi:hypothetical protein
MSGIDTSEDLLSSSTQAQIHFYSEDGGGRVLRNFGNHTPGHTVS